MKEHNKITWPLQLSIFIITNTFIKIGKETVSRNCKTAVCYVDSNNQSKIHANNMKQNYNISFKIQ